MGADQGSVRWHRGGWEIRVQVDGRRHTRRVPGANNRTGRREAEAALEALVARLATGGAVTVSLLLDRYELARAGTWSPSTVAGFTHHRAPIDAALGPVPVDELRTTQIQAAYDAWAAAGAAPGTIRRRHTVLAAALRHAERWGLILLSPARDVQLPAAARAHHEDLPDLGAVLGAIGRLEHRRLAVAARLAVATGARRGELVALRWSDIDHDTGVARFAGSIAVGPAGLVRKGTKSGRPKVLAVDAGTVADLKVWRREARRASLAAGHRLVDTDPVLASPVDPAGPWDPRLLSRAWELARAGVGLERLRFHDLRHLHATVLLGEGIPVPAVAARLGHASSRMTLEVYGHAMPAHDQAAADVIGRASGGKQA